MRIIKFRAWDCIVKEMIHNQQDIKYKEVKSRIYPSETYLAIAFDGCIQNCCYTTYYPYVGDISEKDKDRFEIMQYTGLKDKNGKEIYEGDIIRHKSLSSKFFEQKYVITFKKGAFCIFDEDYGAETILPLCEIDSIEVIGNIYENLELSEEKDE